MKKVRLNDIGTSIPVELDQGCLIDVDGCVIPVRFRPGLGIDLVVLFHPALPPSRLMKPWFQGFLPLDVPQISIADPTLSTMDEVAAGWYLGGEGSGLSARIIHLVQIFAKLLGCCRRIYVGGSSGGFAALLYAGLDRGSVAIAASPQTSLDRYENSHLRKFVTQKYPLTKTLPPESNLPSLFQDNWHSAAIILCSSGDHSHIYSQVLPFVSALGLQQNSKLVLNVEYHGITGHSGSVPPAVYMQWLRAVLLCPDFDADTVMNIHHKMKAGEDQSGLISLSSHERTQSTKPNPHSKLHVANLLRDYHLRQQLES